MKKMTVNDLEAMTTHELSDLLTNIALVLRKLPDVPMGNLKSIERPAIDANQLAASVRQESPKSNEHLPDWLKEEA